MEEKILGYVLVIAGIGIMLASGLNVYMVFTKKAEPVKLFTLQGISMDIAQLATSGVQGQLSSFIKDNQQNIPEQLLEQFNKPKEPSSNKQEIIPAAIINEPLNYMAHIFLMGFFVTIGMKIAQIGTMLIRTIQVNVREKTEVNKH